jgi:phytoene synthase
MTAVDGSTEQAAYCAGLVRTHDFPRYASSLFVAARERRALLALYAFNVEISRVRDSVSQALPGEIRLQWWRDLLANVGHGGVEGNPVAAELLRAIDQWDLPVDPLSRLIDEHAFDLYNDPMPSLAALEGYANDTSAAVFAVAAGIMAPPSAATDHLARHAGLAQGFTQVIAALPRDAARRQLFLPLQFLESKGSGQNEVFAGKQTARMRAAIDQLIGEARGHLQTAFDLLADAPRSVRPVFLPLAMVRRELALMSRADTDPFVPYVPSRLRTLWTLWRAARSREFS